MAKTLKEIKDFIRGNDISIVDFKLTGVDGSNYGYAPVENSDMVFTCRVLNVLRS